MSIKEFEIAMTANCKTVAELEAYYIGYQSALYSFAVHGKDGLYVGGGRYTYKEVNDALNTAFSNVRERLVGVR